MKGDAAALLAPRTARERSYVHPGHSYFSAQPSEVTTILGSCVSVCLFDPASGIGGITHYVLPRPVPGPPGLTVEKIGTTAIVHLHESLVAIGAGPRRLRAKVFGGASMQGIGSGQARDLGGQNADVAFEVLARLSVTVVGQDVGGKRGRKLVFQTDDGSAWIKYLGGDK